jgi:alpha,alpha-trehalase
MIGLGASGRTDLVESMVRNFAYEIDTIGFIPNGNRAYYMSRSQPPFFSAMVNLLGKLKDSSERTKYLSQIQSEYDFWMDGAEQLDSVNNVNRRVVLFDGYLLNRYWDDRDDPRPESFLEDIELASGLGEGEKSILYRNLRAACESGWDFSSRWFEEVDDFQSIRTTEILPVDLNSIMYNMELTLSDLYLQVGQEGKSRRYLKLAENRYNAINEIFWDEQNERFQDFVWSTRSFTEVVNASSFFPLYFKAAQQDLASRQVEGLLTSLLKPGGLVATTNISGQQWDAPNGWAPLQWVAVKGLEHYGFDEASDSIRNCWLSLNEKVFANTGKMMEKYDVVDTASLAGGGEYPTQDGFGWTNGIFLGLSKESVYY